ncbi:MAG: hypothetical protein WB870_06790, partial [Gallionellaceae bacterium]
IGVLDHPDALHGPNNRFVARYAFIAVPVGNNLDLNAIHNQVFDEPTAPLSGTISVNPGASIRDGFFRNEGVGSWEINLAAFLADLNTNEWGQIVGSGVSPPPPLGSANYYQYNEPNLANSGLAFDDARALLAYRYANNYNSLASVNNSYGGALGAGHFAFLNDNIDGYSDGPLMTGFQLPGDVTSPRVNDNPALPWAGADNTNQFFTVEELFNTNETATFGSDLLNANSSYFSGTTNSTYDRYTFYRMLDELGSDSAPESGKINLNYSNAVVQTDLNGIAANISIIPGAETNFVPWTATNFFMAAADRLLRLYTTNWFQANPSNYLATFYGITTNYLYTTNSTGITATNDPNGLGLTNIPFFGMTNQIPAFGVANIPVVINSNFVYSPAVNRLLQLAANIYDAAYYTSNYVTGSGSYSGAYLPSVFRPIFNMTNEPNINGVVVRDAYICGYSEVTSAYEADAPLSAPYDLRNPTVLADFFPGVHSGASAMNVFGVPMIIGAKKGFPNFNQFYMESAFQLTRKLMVTRQSTNVPSPPPNPTSSFFNYYVMYNVSVSNQFGVECWNSYRSNYTRPIDIYVTNFLFMTLNNDEITNDPNFYTFSNHLFTSVYVPLNLSTANPWPGYNPGVNPFSAPLSFLTNFPDESGFNSGIIPTNFGAVPASRYVFNGGSPYLTTNLNYWYEPTPTAFGKYPQPHWWLTMNNSLRVIMVDDASGRIVDYVQLSGPNSVRDLTTEILSAYDTVNGGNNTGYNDLWDTNLVNGVPYGIANQYNISMG